MDTETYLLKMWTHPKHQVLLRSTLSTGTLFFDEIRIGVYVISYNNY